MLGERASRTLLHADGHYGAAELKTNVPVRVHTPRGALNPGTGLEID